MAPAINSIVFVTLAASATARLARRAPRALAVRGGVDLRQLTAGVYAGQGLVQYISPRQTMKLCGLRRRTLERSNALTSATDARASRALEFTSMTRSGRPGLARHLPQ